jgi:hypothetical protein
MILSGDVEHQMHCSVIMHQSDTANKSMISFASIASTICNVNHTISIIIMLRGKAHSGGEEYPQYNYGSHCYPRKILVIMSTFCDIPIQPPQRAPIHSLEKRN